MKIGDIYLCSGNGPLSRLIIRYNEVVLKMDGPASKLSHVAMCGPDATHVFEATTLNKWADKEGVQTNPYCQWIENYDGKVWIRELISNRFSAAQIEKMHYKMKSFIGRDYEHGIPGMLELAFVGWQIPGLSSWWREHLKTKTDLHCSEADAEVLQSAGLLPGYRPNKLPPCVWWDCIGELDYYYKKPKELNP